MPVYYGNVHFEPSRDEIVCGGKYRTSCWITTETLTMENTAVGIDTYFSYDKPVEVYEYDESGHRFTLFTLDAFQKCVLKNTEGKMRERYHVIEKADLNKEEIRYLYEEYKMPFNWMSSFEILPNEVEVQN